MSDMEMLGMIGTFMGVYSLIMTLYTIFLVVCQWKMFSKAGVPGWAAIVPIYSTYKLFEISYGNGWTMLWLLVPFVNIFFAFQQPFKLAKAFGQEVFFGLGLLFLAPIFQAIIAFSNTIQYVGPFEDYA